MSFVVDASVMLARPLGGDSAIADLVLTRLAQEEALAPALWWFEVRNVMVINERRGRVSEEASAGFLRNLAQVDITIDRSPDGATIMALARRHG